MQPPHDQCPFVAVGAMRSETANEHNRTLNIGSRSQPVVQKFCFVANLGTVDGRLRWIEADLASPGWLEALGETQVDAVLSCTAMHWLWPEPLARLYHDLGRVLRPGGVFLNGDHMAFGPALPTFARLSGRVLNEQWTDAAFAARGIETAEQWWDALASEAAFASQLAERAARFAGKQRQQSPPGFDVHVAALGDAGFQEVGTIWQVLSDRVLLAVR